MPRRVELSRRSIARAAVVAIAVAAAVAPVPAAFVERWYSDAFYPALQARLTPLTNLVPISLLDVGGAVVVSILVGRARRLRGRRSVAWGRGALRAIAVAGAALYLAFLVLWGFNYRREPLVQKLDFDAGRVTRASAMSVAGHAVGAVNTLYAAAHASAARDRDVAAAFGEAERALGQRHLAALGRPKRSVLTLYFRWAAVDGMTDPFFLEIIVNPDVLGIERPFVVAHEWAHLAGYADESEANFVAWLACVRGDERAQYSGWLALYERLAATLPRDDRRALLAALEAGPRADLVAIDARLGRSAPVVRQAAQRVYDTYLKANRVPEGIASYDAVVRLVLGTTFENGWVPRLKQANQAATGAGPGR